MKLRLPLNLVIAVLASFAYVSQAIDLPVTVGNGETLTLGDITSGEAKTLTDMSLGTDSKLILGSDSNRLQESFTWSGMASTSSSIYIYLSQEAGKNTLNTKGVSNLKHIYVNGTITLNENGAGKTAIITTIGSATLHMMDGSKLFGNNNNSNSTGSTVAVFENDILLDGTVTFHINGNGILRYAGNIGYESSSTGANITTSNYGQLQLYGGVDLGNGRLTSDSGETEQRYRITFGNGSNNTMGEVFLSRVSAKLENGATLTITGGSETSSALRLGNINTTYQSTIFEISGGSSLIVPNSPIAMSANGGISEVILIDGSIKTLGIDYGFSLESISGNRTAELFLGAKSDGAGTGILEIGTGGIKNLGSKTIGDKTHTPSLELGSGMIKASGTWSTEVGTGNTAVNIKLKSTTGTVFNPNGHTITINHNLVGDTGAKLILNDSTGSGILHLKAKANNFTQADIKKGTLLLTGDVSESTVTYNIDGGLMQLGSGTEEAINLGSNITITGTSSGKLLFLNNSSSLTLGNLSGSFNLEHAGQGQLNLSGVTNAYTGIISVTNNGSLQVSTALSSQVTMGWGSLVNGNNASNIHIAATGNVDLGGARAQDLKYLETKTTDLKVTGISAGTANLAGRTFLTLSVNNFSTTPETSPDVPALSGTTIIDFNNSGAGSILALNGGLTLISGDNSNIASILDYRDAFAINITNAALHVALDNIGFDDATRALFSGYSIDEIDGGNIIISGNAFNDWYTVYAPDSSLTSERTVSFQQDLDRYLKGVWVDGTLNIDMGDGVDSLTLNNFSGTYTTAQINLGATGTTVILNIDDDDIQNTNYRGNISGDADIEKSGQYKLTLGSELSGEGGKLQTSGNLTIKEGTLHLIGQSNIGSTTTVEGGTSLELTGNMTTGAIELLDGSTTTLNNVTLLLNNNSITSIINDGAALNGSGTLALSNGADLTIESGANISQDISLGLDGNWHLTTFVDLSSGYFSGTSQSGLVLNNMSTITLTGNSDTTYHGEIQGEGTLSKTGSGHITLNNTGDTSLVDLDIRNGQMSLSGGSTYRNMNVGTSSLSRQTASGNPTLQVLNNMTGAQLNVYGNSNLTIGSTDPFSASSPVTLTISGNTRIENGATLSTIVSTTVPLLTQGTTTIASQLTWNLVYNNSDNITQNINGGIDDIRLATSERGFVNDLGIRYANEHQFSEWTINIQGNLGVFYDNASGYLRDNTIYASLKAAQNNNLLDYASTDNSRAGANLIYAAGLQETSSTLDTLLTAVMNDINSGNTASAARSMAAAAGASYLGILSAQQADFRHQQMLIRNRITGMGLSQNYQYANELPLYNMWIQGNGAYNKLDSRGDQPGHELTTWGGTVGADLNITSRWTVGAAFTASFGDLKVDGADSLDGDLNNYYVNLFTQYKHKNWTHALILTGGWGEADVDRTVVHSQGLYRANAKSDTSSYGALYEVTYDFAMNKERTTILQPLFSMGIVKSKVDSINEYGAGNAGVNINSFDQTTGTISAGARLLGLIGSNVLGRESVGEVRAQLVQDLGSDHVSADTAYQINPGYTQRIRGAKIGKTGVQLGAGLTIPVGQQGSIFLDANADLRSHANSVSGSIGYRYNF